MNFNNRITPFLFLLLGLLVACQDETNDGLFTNDSIDYTEDFEAKRTCLSHEHMEQKLQDPSFRLNYESRISAFEKYSASNIEKAACSSPTLIPVAIHYQGVANPNNACLVALAENQIDILNKDFQGQNLDISKWNGNAAAQFPGISNGEMCVQFVLADKNHPTGYGLSNGDVDVTINKTQGDTDNKWSGYMNIFVQSNTGVLGYAPLGGSGNGDGIVVDAAAFGSGNGCSGVSPDAPYNLGRTLTHEVGHYLLLDHIWGEGCNQDDEVADTPDQAADNGGCPNIGITSCGSKDLHMNYMDYTNDACMYMFSAGQVSRMTNYMNASLGNLKNNVSNVYSGGGGNTGGGNPGGGNTCDTPSNVTANVTTQTSATISWGSVSAANEYQLRLRKSGTVEWQRFRTDDTSKEFLGLEEGTRYQYSVRTLCSGVNSAYTPLKEFVTTRGNTPCRLPTTTSFTKVSSTSAKVTWSAGQGATQYRIKYRKKGNPAWEKNILTTQTSMTLTGLTAGLVYEYQLKAICTTTSTATHWSQTYTFDLSGGATSEDQTFRIILYLDDYGSETTWELEDDQNNLLTTGGPYQDGQAGQRKAKTVKLENGCYKVTLNDAYGDGICCDYGRGRFFIRNVSKGKTLGFSNGRFGSFHEVEFCVDGSEARLINETKDPQKISRGKKN